MIYVWMVDFCSCSFVYFNILPEQTLLYTFRTPLHSRPPAYLIRICLSKNLCKSGKNVSGLEHLKPVTTGLEHLKPVITRLENPKPVLTGLEHLNQL